MLAAMIHFCVLSQNRTLIPGLLYPLNGAVARPRHGSAIGARPRARSNQDRIVAAPSRMNRAAVVQCTDIDMNGGCVGLVSDHRTAQGRIESNALMRHRNKFWRRP